MANINVKKSDYTPSMSSTNANFSANAPLEIWIAKLSDLREFREKLLTLLNSAERTRCASYLQQDDRDRYLGGRALTKLAVARLTGLLPADINIKLAISGKPYISFNKDDIPAPSISISHSGELVVVALNFGADIGVDVEFLRTEINLDELMGVICSSAEINDINCRKGEKRVRRFYEIWVLKEAYLKATGEGLSDNVRDVTFRLVPEPVLRLHGNLNTNQCCSWTFFLKQYDEQHILALASRTTESIAPLHNNNRPIRPDPLFKDGLSLFSEY